MLNIIDDETATRFYNEIDTSTGEDYDTKAKALAAWADAKDAKRNKQEWDHLTRVYTDFDNYISDEGYSDLDEESRYQIANRQFIANQLGETVEDQGMIYPAKRDIWTQQAFGKKGLSEKETFGLIQQGVQSRNEVMQSANEIPGDIALGLFDSIGNGTAVEVPKLVSIWKERNAEKLKKLPAGWESGLLQAASDYATETEGMLRNYSEPLKQVYDHLAAVTGRDTKRAGETNPKSVQEIEALADTLATMPPEVRDRAYAAVVLGAKQAGQEPKEFLEQWGESWSRTLNMFRSGSMVMQEDAVYSELQLLKEAPKVWKENTTGKLTVYPGFDQSNFQEITPEERTQLTAEAQKKFDRLQVYRELYNIADNQFDPIKKINEGGFGGFMEAMAYGSPQALAYTGMALVPGVGPWLSGAAVYADEYNRLRLDGVDPESARMVAAPSAILQSGLERVGAKMIFGKLPAFEKLMSKIGNPARVGRAGSAGIRFGTAVVGENIVEGTQDLVTPVVQDVADALGADVPDVNWRETLGQWGTSRLDVLAATIPGILIGTGVATMADGKRFNDFNERLDLYRTFGMDEAAIKRVEDNQTPQDRQAALQAEYKKLTPDNIKAGISYMETKIDEAKSMQEDPTLPTMTREQGENGKPVFVVRDEKGTVAYRSEDEQSAMTAHREMLRTRITGATTGIVESLQFIDRVNQAISRGEDIQKLVLDDAPRNLLDEYEANPTEQNLDNLFQTVRAFGMDINEPSELAQFPVLASNQGALAEGIYRSVIRIQDGATGIEVMRDFSQDNLKRAMAEGRVTMDWVREQLNQVIPLIESERTERKLRTETDTDVIESFSDVAVAYMNGKIRDEQIPGGLRGFLRRIAVVVKDIFRRAYRLRRAISEGKIDSNFEAFLAESVGLNQQTMVDTTRERASGDIITDGGQMLMDFSIGSRSNAVSTDTPSIRASNATITGPANYSIGAFHGTPHKVDRFSTDKIGTGEGAQVYGWGLYFAGNKIVADHYRKSVGKGPKSLNDLLFQDAKTPRVINYLTSIRDSNTDISSVRDKISQGDFDYLSKPEQDAIEAYVQMVEQDGMHPSFGNLYSVELDVAPEDLLDWDKPLSQQSEKVKQALEKLGVLEDHPMGMNDLGGGIGKVIKGTDQGISNGGDFYEKLTQTYSSFGERAAMTASADLQQAGIPGIRYLDGSSRSEGIGTYNYVIFDENLIKITEENGNRIPASEALAAPATGATNYSIGVNTTAANILADNLKIPTTIGTEFIGRQIIPIEADLTAGGGSFTQKPAQGGPAFSVIPEYFNAGVVWAAAKDGFWTGKLNLARKLGAIYKGKDGSEKFLIGTYAMKQDSHISNPTIAGEKLAEVSRYVQEGRISAEQEQGLANLVIDAAKKLAETSSNKAAATKKALDKLESRKGKRDEKAIKDAKKEYEKARNAKTFAEGLLTFPTKFTANQFDTYLAGLSFEQRAFIAEKLSSAKAESLGAPPMEQIRRATLDESFGGTQNLSMISLLEIDVPRLEQGLKNKTLTAEAFGVTPHNSYNSLAPGNVVAMFRTPIPYELAFPDIRDGLNRAGYTSNHGYYLKGKIPDGIAKAQHITESMLNAWEQTQTSLRPNQAKAIVSALNQKWVEFTEPRQAGLAEFSRALRNNDAAVTLTQYSPQEVSKLIKDGKMKVYRLGDMNIWFALKRPDASEAQYADPEKDWAIVSVVNNEKAAYGTLPLIMSKAISKGGTLLDCYSVQSPKFPAGLLPTLYGRSGFEVIDTLPFDPQYHTEAGKMGELEKVWHSQNWNGQVKPPVVYMKWNPELHANLGRNADTATAISIAAKNAGGMAERKAQRPRRVAEGSLVSMGGAGQGNQGRGVSDGAGAAGDSGNARKVLPRGVEQVVADLKQLNDYQLQALGLTREEVNSAVQNFESPDSISYSIASQREIDRVNAALGGMNRGPDERLKVYERARERFLRVMQQNKEELDAIRSAVSTNTAPAVEQVESERASKLADLTTEEATEVEKALQDNADTFMPRIEAAQTLAERKRVERDAKDRAKILEKGIRDKYAERKAAIDTEAKTQRQQIEQAAAAKDSAANARMRDKVRHTKLVTAIGELDGILKVLPPEVRGRVGGFAVLANIGTGDKALADFFVKRIDMIDRQLERTLKEEYGSAFDALLEDTKPKKAAAGEKPKGIGADIQSLFAVVREARNWSAEKVDGHIANLETQIASGNLTAKEEAMLTREADLVSLAGDWKNADSSRRAAALESAKETWDKGMSEFIQKKIREREDRDISRAQAILATGKKGDYTDRRKRAAADNGLKGKVHGWFMDTLAWDGVVNILFGHESPMAIRLSDGQRKAEYAKIDAVAAKEEAIHDLFTKLAGGNRAAGEKLMWQMSQPSIPANGLNLSELEALSATMLWMQEDGRRHMEGELNESGIPVGKWHYDQKFIDEIESALSPEAKTVRDYLLDSYGKEWFAINSVYRELNGINLPRIQNYSPVTVVPINAPAGMVTDPVTGNSVSATSISPRALRTRGTAIAEPAFRNVVQTYLAHTRQMEHWKAFAPWIKEANGILRFRDVQNSIKEAGGEEATGVLNRYLDAFSQGGNRDASLGLEISQVLNRMASRAAQVALIGRVGTLAIQTTQIGAASAELPMGAYVYRLGKLLTGNLGWGDSLNSAYIQRRLKQMPPIVQIAMEGLKAGKPNQLKHQVEKIGRLISGSDALWTAGTYAMVYDYNLGQAKSLGYTGKAAEDYAHNTAERITDRLAQPTRMGAKSIYEVTATNPGSRLGWAFASEARKNLALLAYTKANRPLKRFGATALGFIVFNLAMGAFIRNAWKDIRDDGDDEDEFFDSKTWNWKRIGVAMATEPLQGIPYLGDYIEKGINTALGQYHQSSDLINFERGVRAIKNIPDIVQGEREMADVLKDIDGMVSLMGLFNQNAAAAASLTHIASDFFGIADNATSD